jgi:hypothetical protein
MSRQHLKSQPNKVGRANPRPTSPLNAGRQFDSAPCGPPSLSAAVAHLNPKTATCGSADHTVQTEL